MSEQKVAIVTGGASGIGLAISKRLAREGDAVAIFDLNADGAETAAGAITNDGGRAIGVAVDVTDRPGVEAAVVEVGDRLGKPTILVNDAGLTATHSLLDIRLEEWDRVLDVNLTATFHCCQVVIPHMLDVGWGRIVNISSSSIHSGTRLMSAYVAAKTGVVGLTKSLALEFAANGITVNTIPPGFVDTPMLRGAAADGYVNMEKSVATTPVGRPGRPEDIANACAFLVSEEASYITGQIIGVNGGRNT